MANELGLCRVVLSEGTVAHIFFPALIRPGEEVECQGGGLLCQSGGGGRRERRDRPCSSRQPNSWGTARDTKKTRIQRAEGTTRVEGRYPFFILGAAGTVASEGVCAEAVARLLSVEREARDSVASAFFFLIAFSNSHISIVDSFHKFISVAGAIIGEPFRFKIRWCGRKGHLSV